VTNCELEGGARGVIGVLYWHLLGGTEETHEKCEESRCAGRDSNRGPPEYGFSLEYYHFSSLLGKTAIVSLNFVIGMHHNVIWE
jgi:hypothetical protein